jgi:flagellar hook-basal body complex protein FliE
VDIKSIAQLPELAFIRPRETPAPAGGGDAAHPFAEVLKSSLDEVNGLQQKADAAITALATGDKMSLHDTMIAMEQADVSFRLMMQVRNKIVDAYQEIMRIQV